MSKGKEGDNYLNEIYTSFVKHIYMHSGPDPKPTEDHENRRLKDKGKSQTLEAQRYCSFYTDICIKHQLLQAEVSTLKLPSAVSSRILFIL